MWNVQLQEPLRPQWAKERLRPQLILTLRNQAKQSGFPWKWAQPSQGGTGGAAATDVGCLPRTIQKTDTLHLPSASCGNLKPKQGRGGKLSEPWVLYKTELRRLTRACGHVPRWTKSKQKKPNQNPHKKKTKERKENLLPLAGKT